MSLEQAIRYDVEHDLFHPQNIFSDEYITPTFVEYVRKLEAQIEKMKCCSNCKHFNNVDDLEYCQNCERQLVNSLDKLPREEIIKDEWELKE